MIKKHPTAEHLGIMPKEEGLKFLKECYGEAVHRDHEFFENDLGETRFSIKFKTTFTQQVVAATEPGQDYLVVRRQLLIPFHEQ